MRILYVKAYAGGTICASASTSRDKLIKRIKELDPGVNVSQVCRETLKSYCRALERINNWNEDYDEEVEEQMMRLSQEPPVEPDWVGYGLEAARDWVRIVEPRAWQSFWYSHDGFKGEAKESTFLIAFYSRSGGNDFNTRFMENESWFRPPLAGPTEGDRRDAFDKAHEDYDRAWLGYVNEVRAEAVAVLRRNAEQGAGRAGRGIEGPP